MKSITKTSIMKIIILLVILISVLLVCTACSNSNTSNNNSSYSEKLSLIGDPTIEISQSAGFYTLYIRGTVKNNTNQSLSYASIQFSITDNNNVNLGTAFDFIGYINANGTWSFEAMYMGSVSIGTPAHYKLISLTGW